MFPCCYILVKNKDYNIYKKVIERLKEASGRHQLKPKRLTCDFELALINAFKLHFPNASVKGCMFHYGQCIWKNVNLNGFKTKYSKDESFKMFVKKLIALAVVPIEYVIEACNLIKDKLPSNGLTAARKIFAYFQRTWLNGNFPIDLWNHSSTTGPRTNNHVEGFHNKFNKYIKSPHPHLYKLINVFKV
jgi:hypothetical protein